MVVSDNFGIAYIVCMYLIFLSKLKKVFASIYDIILPSTLKTWSTKFNDFAAILGLKKVPLLMLMYLMIIPKNLGSNN